MMAPMDVWEIARLSPAPGHPEVLRSDDGAARVIALSLAPGDLLGEHQVHEHAWLFVLEGTLDVTSGSEVREVGAGSLLHFDPAERHEVQANTETRILLLLAPWPGPGHPSLRA
jgi:quercetin dioxygenase-like cupin family protein